MASFHAELHLTGTSYRVVRCQYACHQPTDTRGRASSKVRHDLLQLALDVPDSDELLVWASTPHKPLSGQVVFYDITQQVAHETIAFSAGECVGYQEIFESGAGSDGAYVCHLTIAAAGFELRGGGPAVAAMAMAAMAIGSSGGGDMAENLPSAALAAGANIAEAAAPAVLRPIASAEEIAAAAAVVASNLATIDLKAMPKAVNPENGMTNCTHITEAVVARLRGTDPEAVAPATGQLRQIPEIEAMYGIAFQREPGTDFHTAFREIESHPDGTIGLFVMLPKGPGTMGHIVTVVNNNGKATIIEGQRRDAYNPAELITSSTLAERRYGDEAATHLMMAILPPPSLSLPA
jgi:hypothetical protein